MDTNADLNGFLALSSYLTGVDYLNEVEGEKHFDQLRRASGYNSLLPALIARYHTNPDGFESSLTQPEKNCCKGLIFLWYTAELIDFPKLDAKTPEGSGAQSPESYYAGLIWKVISAHPPGLSGGYYGYWKYEPEN